MKKSYFGVSLLGMGGMIDKGQTLFFVGRVCLMALGAMTLEYLMSMGFDGSKIVSAAHLFTGKLIEGGPETLSKVLWVLFAAWLIHAAAFFAIGWKKHKKTLDGDDVAKSLFEDINVTVIREESA